MGVTRLFIEWFTTKKPKFLGLPDRLRRRRHDHAAGRGLRDAGQRRAIGIIAGGVCLWAVGLKNKLQWDDAPLTCGGARRGRLGILLLGVVRQRRGEPAGADVACSPATPKFFSWSQCGAVAFSSASGVRVHADGMLWFIDRVTPVKVADGVEERGLDDAARRRRTSPERSEISFLVCRRRPLPVSGSGRPAFRGGFRSRSSFRAPGPAAC